MTTQTVETWELMIERPKMVEGITDLIVADSISTLVETELGYKQFSDYFSQCGLDIVELYKIAKEDLDLSAEYHTLYSLVEEVISTIGSDLFTDMLDTDEDSAHSEVLRCFGHGVSFWDNHSYTDFDYFGFTETPRLKITLESPYDVASQILDKIAEAHPEYLSDEKETENNDFDQWLASNYSPAGADVSNGEKWFLSNSPHEFMPIPLSKLREQWEKDNSVEEKSNPDLLRYSVDSNWRDIENKEFWLVVRDNTNGETIYSRLLEGDISLDITSYLREIQRYTGLKLDKSPMFPGCGQIGITIGYSATPEKDTCVWDTEDYFLA